MPSTPTNHYALTKKQLAILDLLYRFRFGTSDLLAKSTLTNKDVMNKRLRLMMELGYVGRKFEPEYHLLRKHASYYLLPAGVKALKQSSDRYSSTILRNINKDKSASERFIGHHLDVFSVYCTLQAQYGDELRFFTKSQLTNFEHFPQPLPDAYIRHGDDNDERQFFVDVLHESQPFFIATCKIMQYIAYADESKDIWEDKTESELPNVLLICDSPSLQKRLLKRMRRAVGGVDGNNMRLYMAVMSAIRDDDAWHDMAEPDEVLSLDDIQ